MKKLFFTMVAMVMAVMSYAQSSLIATLSHEGNVSIFHGPSSFKQAMAAAVDGDIISLAGGIYEATNITKGITLRGSGIEKDTISNAYPTEIQGSFNINVPDSCPPLLIEGVNCTSPVYWVGMKNPTFMKSKFYTIDCGNGYRTIENLTMLHCYITYYLNLPRSTANIINSCIYSLSGSSLDMSNCYITCNPENITKSLIRNSIIYTSASSAFPSTDMIYNCVGVGSNIFKNHTINNNITLTSSQWNALFSEMGLRQLTDEAKEKYKGDDGTEVGIYGGSLPFDMHISKPQITKCNIAQKTTADGKLSVDIEVKGVE